MSVGFRCSKSHAPGNAHGSTKKRLAAPLPFCPARAEEPLFHVLTCSRKPEQVCPCGGFSSGSDGCLGAVFDQYPEVKKQAPDRRLHHDRRLHERLAGTDGRGYLALETDLEGTEGAPRMVSIA